MKLSSIEKFPKANYRITVPWGYLKTWLEQQSEYGGKLIFERKFRGIINSAKESDGYYFTIGDTTFELSGDVQIIEIP